MLFETPTIAGREAAGGAVVSPARVEETPTSHLFFHPRNVEALHTSIRYRVYQRTGEVIDRQGDNQLRVLMAAAYEEPAAGCSAGERLRELNGRVVGRAADEIAVAMGMHRRYVRDVSTPVPVPLERGQFADDRTGTRSRQLPVGF